jgi:hypothetical protein
MTHATLGIVVSNLTYSSGRARTTIDESAKAIATATANASSRAEGEISDIDLGVIATLNVPQGRNASVYPGANALGDEGRRVGKAIG